jgi:excisionase family DNA binding protein
MRALLMGEPLPMAPETPPGGPSDPLSSRLLTLHDVADRLQVSPRTVRRLIDKGELGSIRIGRCVRIRPEVLKKLIAGK